MASYLAEVKDGVKSIFDDAFDALWTDVVEPALKESYKNGVADGKKAHDSDQKPEQNGTGRRNRFRRPRTGGKS